MSSTFLGLNTAYTGLQASNAALNTTANNIANVESEGYSRQQVQTQAANPIRSFTTYGCVGAGVDTLAIERVRDLFYDQKFWENNSKLGEYEVKDYYMDIIQKYYKDDDRVKGFNKIFDEFYSALEELAKTPGDVTVRQQAIGFANNLCTYFNEMYTNLQKLQTDINHEMKVNTDRINSISQEICALNKQINVIEMNSGIMANELRDQRDLLVDELSKIVDVDVEEIDIIDTNSPLRDTGGTRYVVKICGQTLVDGNAYKTLTCVPRENSENVNQTDVDGLYDIYFTGEGEWTSQDYRDQGDALNVYGGTTCGKLAGLIQLRDGNNGEQFAGTVTTVDTAAQKVTVEVSADYLTDLNKLNLAQTGGIITIGDTRYYYKNWTYNYVEGENGKGTCTFEFELNKEKNKGNNVTVFAATQKLDATIGPDIEYQGIPYYLSQMNEWVRMFSTAYNNIMKSGVQDNGDAGLGLFTCENADGKEYTFFDKSSTTTVSYEKTGTAGNTITVTDHDDSYYQLTAGNFKIVGAILKDANKLATRTEQYTGDDHNDVVKSLIDLRTNKKAMSFRGCCADQYLVCMLADVALNAQRAETFKDNYKIMGNTISNQRLSVSGVDNDEEAVNLTKFQQGYNMASKMIQVLTEVYDRLILQTGV
ncbi:MAG: flagellar hook-associated protein FlgK [Lachnospiraceae bacterium]|nr:flagellar hook-associated protein FlgK [Lachnospiraceae bacterium]